jgi:hypothetical protein
VSVKKGFNSESGWHKDGRGRYAKGVSRLAESVGSP